MIFRTFLSLWMASLSASYCQALSAADWPQFRGGMAQGHAPLASLPAEWSTEKNLAWRVPIPGSGWSQPIVVDGRIFLTTAVMDRSSRPKGMTKGVMSTSTWGLAGAPKTPLQMQLLCIDPKDGSVLWLRTLLEAVPRYGKHASNTFATETPCASADTLFAFFGATGTFVALDLDGQELWRREFGPQSIQNHFGTGSSPALLDGRLFLQFCNEEEGKLLCIDATTGKDLWQADRNKGTSWSTPVVWSNMGTLEVISAASKAVIAYAVADGKERWRIENFDTSFACSVVSDEQGVYMGTSSPGSKALGAAIAAGHTGDLTLPKGTSSSDAVRWFKGKIGAEMPSPVVVDDLLYFFGKAATCCDKLTGVEKFHERLPGGLVVASPLVVGRKIYLVNEKGTTLVMQAGESFKIVAECPLTGNGEVFWATPAITEDALLIRSSDALYCIRQE